MVSALVLLALGQTTKTEAFLNAINAKDRAILTEYVRLNMGTSITHEARTQRLWPIVENGAPFTLVRMVDQTPSLERALVRDRNQEELGLTLELKDGKILRLALRDPESLTVPPPKDYTGWTELPALVSAVRKDTGVPGLVVAVQRGKLTEVAVDGVRSVSAPATARPTDIWHIGSIGKSMTSTLIAKLIEQGKLRWDTTLKEALPNVTMNSGYGDITLLQLMRHRGGVVQDMNFNQAQVDTIVGNETEPTKIRDRYVRNILVREAIGKPDGQFRYSNAGYAILGHIAERVAKKPYEKLMADMLFKPLGMSSSQVGEVGLPTNRAHGHVANQGGWKAQNMTGPLGILIAPAGNIYCSAEDLLKFGTFHLDGMKGKSGYLKSATIKKLHEGVAENPGGPLYACGWSLATLPGTSERHGHNGSNGTMRAELSFFVDADLVVAAVVNAGGEAEPSPSLQALEAVARRYAPGK